MKRKKRKQKIWNNKYERSAVRTDRTDIKTTVWDYYDEQLQANIYISLDKLDQFGATTLKRAQTLGILKRLNLLSNTFPSRRFQALGNSGICVKR